MKLFRLSLFLLCTTLMDFSLSLAEDQIPLSELNLTLLTQDWGSPRRDKSVEGNPMRIGGQEYKRGIGTHAKSEAKVKLDGRATRFTALVGVDDEVSGGKASVIFRVFGDAKLLFESTRLQCGDRAQRIDIPLGGVRILRLQVDDAGDGISHDHANWAEPIITYSGATPEIVPNIHSLSEYISIPKLPRITKMINIEQNIAAITNEKVGVLFDLKNGKYNITDNLTNKVMVQNAWFCLDPGIRKWGAWQKPLYKYSAEDLGREEDALGTAHTLRVWYLPQEGYEPERFLDIKLYSEKSFISIGWGVRNQFNHTLRVSNAEVMLNAELFTAQTPKAKQVLRGGAGAEANIVEDGADITALNSAMLTYRDGDLRHTVVAGGLQYSEFAREVKIKEDNAKAHLTLRIWDPQGKRVLPLTTYTSPDTFYLDVTTSDPFESLEQFGSSLALINEARPNVYDFPTTCGWMVSTSSLGEGKPINNSTGLVGQMDIAQESGILKYTPVAVRLEPDYYCYANRGDTQQGWYDDEHWAKYDSLTEPYETFAKFSSAVKSRGGIVFTYFQSSMPSNDFAVAHPDWMLNDDISQIHTPHPHHQPIIRYDFTDKNFQTHMKTMWKRLAKDGVVGIKFDYPETAWARHGGFEDKNYTTTSAYRKLFELAREGLGKNAYLHERNLGGATHESVPRLDCTVGTVDLQRVWGDASHFEPEMASRIGLRWYKSGKAFRYYPDGKSFYHRNKKPLSTIERRTFLTLIGLLSGRIELGTSYSSMTKEMFYDLTRLYPMLPNTQAFRPTDMLICDKHPSTYSYKVSPNWTQVILVNNDLQNTKTISAPLSGIQAETGSLELDPTCEYWAFDFWEQHPLGKLKGESKLSLDLQPGEARVFSLHKVESRPQIIGTSRHVMCGMMELHDVTWNAEDNELRFSADLIQDEPLLLTIALPDGTELQGGASSVKQNNNFATATIEGDGRKNVVLKFTD